MSLVNTSALAASKLFSLQGKTVVLTGASGYLGRTFSRVILENEGRLIALGRSQRILDQARKLQDEFGTDRISAHQIDMYDLDALGRLFETLSASEPTIDVLVNNAHELGLNTGFNTLEGSLENASFDQWHRHFLGGMYWPALAVQKLGPKMKAKGGSIINISTMYALVAPSPALYEGTPSLNPPGYSASKAALLAFTRYVASFWGAHGIRANAILPGPFSNLEDAEGQNSLKEDDPLLKRLKARTCLHRIGHPRELCGALLFLASDASSYVTGHALSVDGGWAIT